MNAPTDKKPVKQEANAKQERLAKALRQNLLRRKQAAAPKQDEK